MDLVRGSLSLLELLLAAHGPALQTDGAWRPAPGAASVQEDHVEAPGAPAVGVRDGVLVRLHAGGAEPVGCTADDGPGRVLDLALDPAGLVVVAAERGVFVLDPARGDLDLLQRADGAPPGRPTSVHVDAARRVWLATDEAVGPLDPSFGFGRVIAPAEGAPGPGPYAVGPGDAGELLVAAQGSVYRYFPEAPAPPVLGSLTDGTRTLSPGERVRRTYGETLALTAAGAGAGGATFRWRADGHHVWRDAPGGSVVVAGLAPGLHPVDVVAVDRDLARSPPWRVQLEVAPPRTLGKRFLLGTTTGAAALVLAVFLARARRAGGGAGAYARAVASAALFVALGLQIVAGLVPHAKGWPFVGFSMYCQRYRAGDAIHRPELVGLALKGGLLPIAPQEVGVAVDSPWQVLRPLLDGGEAAAREYVEEYNRRFPGRALRGLEVRAERVRLTRHGPVHVAPMVLGRWVLAEEVGG